MKMKDLGPIENNASYFWTLDGYNLFPNSIDDISLFCIISKWLYLKKNSKSCLNIDNDFLAWKLQIKKTRNLYFELKYLVSRLIPKQYN